MNNIRQICKLSAGDAKLLKILPKHKQMKFTLQSQWTNIAITMEIH